MRVAALYDIHGNLPALEAVLAEVADANVDRIVVGGDVVPGPMPRECLARLITLEVPAQFIHGNGDREVLAQLRGTESAAIPERFRDAMRWNARQLPPDLDGVIAAWPATIRAEIDGVGAVLFCHATPRNDTEIFTRLTSDDRLRPIFAALDVSMVVCGHTHMQFDRTIGAVRVVNAGSVGMPFGKTGADWLLLGPDVRLMHTDYDLAAAAQRVRSTSYPQAEEFATQYILNSPSVQTMLDAYSRAELS
jgi:putative phosphoesterase